MGIKEMINNFLEDKEIEAEILSQRDTFSNTQISMSPRSECASPGRKKKELKLANDPALANAKAEFI